MVYKLLIGNNFILENPKKVNFLNSEIFSVDEDIDGPYIDTQLMNQQGTKIIEIIKNNITFCNKDLKPKIRKRDHIQILDDNGEIILESRVVGKDTIIVSGKFESQKETLTITQNYILFNNGKRIMHSKISAQNNSIQITENGIIS